MSRVGPHVTLAYLKVKVYWNLEDNSIKFITEDKKEYTFTDGSEAFRYFEGFCMHAGLGHFDITQRNWF